MFKRCKHEWKVLDKTEFPSAYEQRAKSGETGDGSQWWVYQRKVLVILTCKKCGKLKHFTEENPRSM